MNKPVNYRTITVAIGIVVAMVIALTLWMWSPRDLGSNASPTKPGSLLMAAKEFLKTASSAVEEIIPMALSKEP